MILTLTSGANRETKLVLPILSTAFQSANAGHSAWAESVAFFNGRVFELNQTMDEIAAAIRAVELADQAELVVDSTVEDVVENTGV